MKKSNIKNQISKIKNTAGILNTEGELTKALLRERRREKQLEEEKIKRLFPPRYLKKFKK